MPEYVFKTAGNVRFCDRVVTKDGPKPLGECRLFDDELRFRNSDGEEYWGRAVIIGMMPELAIAIAPQED